ncbi:MAG: hypothetical protein IKO44_00460 [Ruminococcus sp.]|nr:hypothetical protein [Ruminococcus sp.]
MKHGFIDIPTLYYFKEKNLFTGSCKENFNFRIFAKKLEDDSTELRCIVWEGKENFSLIDPSDYKLEFREEMSEEGVAAIANKIVEAATAYEKNGYKF